MMMARYVYRDNDAAAMYAQWRITNKRVLCIPWTALGLAGHIILIESKGTDLFCFCND